MFSFQLTNSVRPYLDPIRSHVDGFARIQEHWLPIRAIEVVGIGCIHGGFITMRSNLTGVQIRSRLSLVQTNLQRAIPFKQSLRVSIIGRPRIVVNYYSISAP